jgi:hypothetical protein
MEPGPRESCHCRGTGTLSGVVSLNGAVLVLDEPCPWCLDAADQTATEPPQKPAGGPDEQS